MQDRLRRPGSARGTLAQGPLFAEHFQVSYATTDMDRAQAMMRERFGIGEFRDLEGPLPAGGYIRAALAWVGSVMYELLWAEGPGSEFYRHGLPEAGHGLCFHHLGYLVYSMDDWRALLAGAGDSGLTFLYENNNEGFLRHCFFDAPELGHYLEYILPEPAGLDFFNNVPVN